MTERFVYREYARRASRKGHREGLVRRFRLSGAERRSDKYLRIHLTALSADGLVDPRIDRAYVDVGVAVLERIFEATQDEPDASA